MHAIRLISWFCMIFNSHIVYIEDVKLRTTMMSLELPIYTFFFCEYYNLFNKNIRS